MTPWGRGDLVFDCVLRMADDAAFDSTNFCTRCWFGAFFQLQNNVYFHCFKSRCLPFWTENSPVSSPSLFLLSFSLSVFHNQYWMPLLVLSTAASDMIMLHHCCAIVCIGCEYQNVYVSSCVSWFLRHWIISRRSISRAAAFRCPTWLVELVSGRHLAVCWTFRELGPGSVNVLSLLLDLRHGTRYPSTSELLHPWRLLNGCLRHTCLKYRFSHVCMTLRF